ncbi:winged helix-turn-helix domain-containing protein [Shewanella sp. GXUN23E]|uniref:winged helix-turn-helix domain-containing protein n=1 Tax=Shewanella sp. GXUN23E TaxID=3422498 RepID=UPI003D7EF584
MIDVRYKINDLVLHVSEGKLCFQDRKLCIEPRLVNLLGFFARHPETVFSREELIQSVWEGAVVTEQVVTQSVFELRKLLTECDQAGIITTIPKRGYKLSADIEIIEADTLSCECEHPGNDDKPRVQTVDTAVSATPPVSPVQPVSESPTPFPAGPMSQALCSLSTTPDKPLLSGFAEMANALANRLFDTLMLLVLVAIVGYLTLYQAEHTSMPELDNQLIAIESSNNAAVPDHMGLLAYGISKTLQRNIEQFSHYRTRYISSSQQTPGKRLMVSIDQREDGAYLTVRLYSHATERDIYHSSELLTQENLAQVIRHTGLALLDDLHVSLNDSQRQALIQSTPNADQGLKPLLLASYWLHESVPQSIDKGIALLDTLLSQQPNNGEALALRYTGYAQLLALSNQSTDNNVLRNYGQALTDYLQHNAVVDTPEFWNAVALHAVICGQDTDARHALAKSYALTGDYTSLGYIILGKLSERTQPVVASEAFSQAYYLNRSPRTYKLCQSLVHPSELSQSAPVLAKLN